MNWDLFPCPDDECIEYYEGIRIPAPFMALVMFEEPFSFDCDARYISCGVRELLQDEVRYRSQNEWIVRRMSLKLTARDSN